MSRRVQDSSKEYPWQVIAQPDWAVCCTTPPYCPPDSARNVFSISAAEYHISCDAPQASRGVKDIPEVIWGVILAGLCAAQEREALPGLLGDGGGRWARLRPGPHLLSGMTGIKLL